MDQPGLPILKTDKGFKNLIPPLHRQEYLQLEQNLIEDGCIDPIITWNGIIIDGHNRYEICHRHNIPFRVVSMEFECREEVVAWICAHQLGRRNITEETRKFLIGMQFESEKVVNNKRNALGINQYTYSAPGAVPPADPSKQKLDVPSGHKTAKRIADEHHIAWNTVQKYATYTRALELIGSKVPEVVPRILSGRYKISHDNIVEMANLSPENIRKVIARIESNQQQVPFFQYKRTRHEIQGGLENAQHEGLPPAPSIKDMPKFDPDAELTSLTLTVPSWASTIRRARKKTDLQISTQKAKNELLNAMTELMESICEIVKAVKES